MLENNPLRESGPLLSDRQIEGLESQLGVSLPHDYRQFLRESNGGISKKRKFILPNDSKNMEYWVDEFFTIDSELANANANSPSNSLAFWVDRFGSVIPKDFIMIGGVCRDDILLLCINGPRRGGVYLIIWNAIRMGPDELIASDILPAIRFASNSFAEFYAALY